MNPLNNPSLERTAEKPIYLLPQLIKRSMVPKIISLLALGLIFYLGVLLNVALLNLTAGQETLTKFGSLVLLLFLIAVGLFLSLRHSHENYLFYPDRIEFSRKRIYYREIINTSPKQDFWDKVFKTNSYNLGNNFYLKHLSQQINMEDYLKQLLVYAGRTVSYN
ncbi:MAG TPA: hypothetical protein VJC39_02295 [Candidatus Nanoarchaeia archaeon]|nr:hypothetical protein [Candidatus Nanoarchaeia archaeon]